MHYIHIQPITIVLIFYLWTIDAPILDKNVCLYFIQSATFVPFCLVKYERHSPHRTIFTKIKRDKALITNTLSHKDFPTK